jgi:hypothetical protein
LLLPQAEQRAAFYHLTFQDFLAAQLIPEREADLAASSAAGPRTSSGAGCLSFVFGSLLARHTLPDRASACWEDLIDPLTLAELPLAVVVADCLEILGGRGLCLQDAHDRPVPPLVPGGDRARGRIARRVASWAWRWADWATRGSPKICATTTRRAWVEVPAGKYGSGAAKAFWVGTAEETDVRNRRPLSLEPLSGDQRAIRKIHRGGRIRRFAVVVRGWLALAGGREDHRAGRVAQRPLQCAKSTGRGRLVLGSGSVCQMGGGQLPTAHEWEAAARGPNGSAYPWGDDWEDGICNSAETKLGQTSPVGIFPRSRTPTGLEDMAGNVWEWCADAGTTPWEAGGRVFRGGGWGLGSRAAGRRSASRSCRPTASLTWASAWPQFRSVQFRAGSKQQ